MLPGQPQLAEASKTKRGLSEPWHGDLSLGPWGNNTVGTFEFGAKVQRLWKVSDKIKLFVRVCH